VTSAAQIWQGLCTYFGDTDTIPDGRCTCCSWCASPLALEPDMRAHACTGLTATPASMPTSSTTKSAALDPKRLQAVLDACPVRDDARLLSRLAFGISSPRITALGLGRHAVFGSMDTCARRTKRPWTCGPDGGCPNSCDFEALLAYFEKACEEAGHINLEGAITSSTAGKKRAPTGAARGRGGGGWAAKRGRK
jgi:hypothetical protein